MRIAICVKPVPDLSTAYVSKSRVELVEQSKEVANPADENAIELALSLRKEGDELVAFTVGADTAADALRRVLTMGVDRAHLVDDPAAQGGDALANAKVLAAAISQAGPFDLVLCGARSVVHNAGQVAGRLAEALGMAFAARVTAATVSDGRAGVKRAGSLGATELSLPAVLAVEPGCNSPRLPNAMAVMKAARKPLEHVTVAALNLAAEQVGERGSAVRLRLMQLPEG
jgi:electron transfer flavoprotein beta subunit